ncbi:hypothetical protein QYM36_002477 [Artemia franciscana]|uniref:Uncharacterized protein n=1 Tax=Artemia franciscana TaxID=6661 RepID=A0AA88LHI9_ARTSF|nr:hypothetical protein QYM36_002477 [Artemia franciscana]
MREDYQSFDKFDDRNQDSVMNNCVSKDVNSTSVEISELKSSFRRVEGTKKLNHKIDINMKRIKTSNRSFVDSTSASVPVEAESVSTRLKPREDHLEKRSSQRPREAVNLRKKKGRGKRKERNLNLRPNEAEGFFVQLLVEPRANNSNYEPSRKRPLEEMGNPGGEAMNLKKRKTCDLSLENLIASGQTILHDAYRCYLASLSISKIERLIKVLCLALSSSQIEVKKLEDANMRLQRDSKRTIDSINVLMTPDCRFDSPENECQATRCALSLENLNALEQTFLHHAARSVLIGSLSRSQKEVLIKLLNDALSRSQEEVKKLKDASMSLQRDSERTIDSINMLMTPD